MKRGIIIFILLFLWGSAFSSDHGNNRCTRLHDYYKWMDMDIYNNVIRYSNKYGVSPELICAVIQSESGGRQFAKSRMGARGLMQVMEVHKHSVLPVSVLYIKQYNIGLGTWYLRKCLKKAPYVKISRRDKVRYQGVIKEACRMYNSGIGRKRLGYKNWKYTDKIYRDYIKTRRSR